MKTISQRLLVVVLVVLPVLIWVKMPKFIKISEDGQAALNMDKGNIPESEMIQLPVFIKEVPAPGEEAKKTVKIQKAVKMKSDKAIHQSGKKNKAGTVPDIFAGYEMPVEEYIQYMRSKGGRVLVYDNIKDLLVCAITEEGVLVRPSDISNMSHRSRRLTTDFPESKEIFKKVESRFGTGSYEILLLLPNSLEESIRSSIARIVHEKGLRIEDISTVFVTYTGNSKYVTLFIEKVSGSFGIRNIKKEFSL